MKKLLLLILALLWNFYVFSQVAKVRFEDGTVGYAVDQELLKFNSNDTLVFASLDKKVWYVAPQQVDSLITTKIGVIQRLALPNAEWCAKVMIVGSKKTEFIDDGSVCLFTVGDTIQMVKRKDNEGEEVFRVYFGQLPGKPFEESQLVIIKKIFQMKGEKYLERYTAPLFVKK